MKIPMLYLRCLYYNQCIYMYSTMIKIPTRYTIFKILIKIPIL